MRTKALFVVSVVALSAGCTSKPPATATSVAPSPAGEPPPPPQTASANNPNASNVTISEDIRKACGLSHSEAFFAYDSSTVRAADTTILKKLAECFTSGPLKGRQMKLVGHADPRGDEDYNYVLAQHRADSVKSAIVDAGMSAGSVLTTSRGENDAKGVDENGWSKDRRVEILLGT